MGLTLDYIQSFHKSKLAPNWTLAVAQNNLFMISLERTVSMVFSVHSLSYFTIEKKVYSSGWMFNNLTKLTKIPYLDGKKFNATGFLSFSLIT